MQKTDPNWMSKTRWLMCPLRWHSYWNRLRFRRKSSIIASIGYFPFKIAYRMQTRSSCIVLVCASVIESPSLKAVKVSLGFTPALILSSIMSFCFLFSRHTSAWPAISRVSIWLIMLFILDYQVPRSSFLTWAYSWNLQSHIFVVPLRLSFSFDTRRGIPPRSHFNRYLQTPLDLATVTLYLDCE